LVGYIQEDGTIVYTKRSHSLKKKRRKKTKGGAQFERQKDTATFKKLVYIMVEVTSNRILFKLSLAKDQKVF